MLRLRDLRINQVPFFYQTYEGTADEVDEDGNLTGESVPKYSNPVRVLARVSPNSGNAEDSPFGKDVVYDKTYQLSRSCLLMNTRSSSLM